MNSYFYISSAKKLIAGSVVIACSVLLYSCNNAVKETKEPPAKPTGSSRVHLNTLIRKASTLLHDGDLVTRSDDDFESLSLQNFSKRDRTYSHSGIAFLEDSVLYVYHSMAGQENPSQSMKREPFYSFVNPIKKTGFGIFRYTISPAEVDKLHLLYKKYYAEKLPFDKSFNLQNSDSMYCSEVIYKSLQQVTDNRIILPTSVLTNFKPKIVRLSVQKVFFKKFVYVGLDDLYMNPFCTQITRVTYQ